MGGKIVPIKRFYVTKNGRVTGVRLRAGLGSAATEYDLEIACRNIKEDRVEVVVNGSEKNIVDFHSYVKGNDVRLFPDKSMYEVSKIEGYEGPLPDWEHYTNAFVLEHLEKGFKYVGGKLDKLDKLENIDKKLGELIEALKER
jgi:acylphosphatase